MEDTYYRDILNRLMEYKNSVLYEMTGIDGYYLLEDKEAIYSWSEDDARTVVIKINTEYGDMDICPFCLYQSWVRKDIDDLCTDCPYREEHGQCGHSDDDDYTILTDSLDGDAIADRLDMERVHKILQGE